MVLTQRHVHLKAMVELLYLYFFQSLSRQNNLYDNFTYPMGWKIKLKQPNYVWKWP